MNVQGYQGWHPHQRHEKHGKKFNLAEWEKNDEYDWCCGFCENGRMKIPEGNDWKRLNYEKLTYPK